MSPEIRINRFLASCGLGSRRKCERLVTDGLVTINGERVDDLAISVDPGNDLVAVSGEVVRPSGKRLVLVLNKPIGVLSSAEDDRGRITVVDMAKDLGYVQRLYPVGRLDMDTSGIILLTDDGDLSFRLTHPAYKVVKSYEVIVYGQISDDIIEAVRKGVDLDEFTTGPCEVELISRIEKESLLIVKLREGKKRQIRRMFRKFGHEVKKLRRTAIGGLDFTDVRSGHIRPLTPAEELTLRQETGLDSKE